MFEFAAGFGFEKYRVHVAVAGLVDIETCWLFVVMK